jgi:lipid-binding SYLF domain-containing protein
MTKLASIGRVLVGAVTLCVAPLSCGGKQEQAQAPLDSTDRIKGVEDTIALFKQKDSTIEQLFSQSAGYVVLPTIGEGAFIVGGGHGSGEAFEGGKYVGRVTVNELTLGAQIGGQSYSQVVFFETPVDFKRLKDNAFTFNAEVTAIAADQGAAKNAVWKDGVATFIVPKKGLMAAAAVGGQKLDFRPAK